jgi:hypothetical protein
MSAPRPGESHEDDISQVDDHDPRAAGFGDELLAQQARGLQVDVTGQGEDPASAVVRLHLHLEAVSRLVHG